jgi:hypothetical protein
MYNVLRYTLTTICIDYRTCFVFNNSGVLHPAVDIKYVLERYTCNK